MEMKKVIKRITTGEDAARIRSNIAGVLAVLWMIVIFILSGQNKEESGAISGGMRNRVLDIGGWFLHLNIDEEALAQLAITVERIIRKSAHMTEFAILAQQHWIPVLRRRLPPPCMICPASMPTDILTVRIPQTHDTQRRRP